jgi:large subunit ribosomal protein L3
MTDIRKPRCGSLAFRPRKRASNQNCRVYWQEYEEARILGFAGYKAGMVSVAYVDPFESPTKGQEVVGAATVIEVPPIFVFGARGYYDGVCVGEVWCEDENVLKTLNAKKRQNNDINILDKAEKIRLLAYAQPSKTGIGKKHIECFEIGIGGGKEEQFKIAQEKIGKELKASDVFKPGEFVDVIAVTKGKGWQGPVKRFGVSLQRPKATGRRRHVGTLGQWHPNYVLYTVPQAGQMGYHKRTELNKWIMSISDNVDEINPKSGFFHYGFVKNEYILLKGSVPGPVKRLIKLRLAVRKGNEVKEPRITEIIV